MRFLNIIAISGLGVTALAGLHYYLRRSRDVLLNSNERFRPILDRYRAKYCKFYVVSRNTTTEEFEDLLLYIRENALISKTLFFDVMFEANINNIPQKLIAVILSTRPGFISVLIRLDQISVPLPEVFYGLFENPDIIKMSSKCEFKAFIIWKFCGQKMRMKNLFDIEFLQINAITEGHYFNYLYNKATEETLMENSSFFAGAKTTEAFQIFEKLSSVDLVTLMIENHDDFIVELNGPLYFDKVGRWSHAEILQWGPHDD